VAVRPLSLASFLGCAAIFATVAVPAWTETTTGKESTGKETARQRAQAASAMEFAKTHHPELAALLDQLRTNAPKDFEAAVLDLERTREKLERSRKNLPERYELELAEWKLNSRIRLMAARLAMGGDSTLEEELRDALRERHALRIQLLKDERDRAQKRMERLDEQIAEQQRRADDILNREFTALRSTGATSSEPRKPAAAKSAPAATRKPNKPDANKELAKPAPDNKPTK